MVLLQYIAFSLTVGDCKEPSQGLRKRQDGAERAKEMAAKRRAERRILRRQTDHNTLTCPTLALSLSRTHLAVSFAGGLAGLSPSRFNTLEAKYLAKFCQSLQTKISPKM